MTFDLSLPNRLKKRFKHLLKWAKREQVSCFRIYEKDLPDYPLIVDWYDGDVVVWLYDRTRDDTPDKRTLFESFVWDSVCLGLGITKDHVFMKYRRRQKGLDSQYEKVLGPSYTKVVSEGGLQFEVNLTDYLDTGLFLDHRKTRHMCREMSKGKRVLNLFAYTGSFTCYARAGGAVATTTVDLSKTYCEWVARNMSLNGFQLRSSDRVLAQDCLSFLDQAQGKEVYDLIVCDPPTFSNSKKMKTTFSVDDHYAGLLRSCCSLLSPGGVILFSTNSRSFKFDQTCFSDTLTISELTDKTWSLDFQNKKSHRSWRIVTA